MNDVFKALNDPTRRAILDLLKVSDMSAGDIANHFQMTKPSISHHLDLLKRADLVFSDKRGQFVYYAINTTVVDNLFQWVFDLKQVLSEKKVDKGNTSDTAVDIPDNLSGL